jgi:two-component system, response regulator YesN
MDKAQQQKMLVTMCIIDDIRSVVEGIATQIDWMGHGIAVCGTAINGEDGLQLVEAERPDIILTDIRMPKLDGLELTRLVRELLPDSKVILMTGFSDFEYARQAIHLGAFDFLSKPFSLTEIEEIVVKAKEAVVQNRDKEHELHELKQRVKESMPVLRQEYFSLLIHHKADQGNARRIWEFVQPAMHPEHLSVLVIEIDGFAESSRTMPIGEVELARFALQNIVEETIAVYTQGVVFRDSTDRFAAVVNMPHEGTIAILAEACRDHISQYTRFTISIGVGREVRHIHELSQSYEEAMRALSYHFYTGGNGVFLFEDVDHSEAPSLSLGREREQELMYALQSGNRSRSLAILEEWFSKLTARQPLPEPEYLVSLFNELGSMILRTLQEKIAYAELAPLEAPVRELRTGTFLSLADMQRLLRELVAVGSEKVEGRVRSDADKVVEEAVRYVKDHLGGDLSVNAAAKKVHLSASYFANVFKKVTGTTFNQFVTQERMEQAKRMLLNGHQVQEIAEALGYGERRYFSEVFKKYTEMTPSDFKQAYTE